MKIKFINIKSNEEVSFDGTADRNIRSALIDSYVNSSNLGVNSNKGQDFAWRLDPEVQAEFDEIKSDYVRLKAVADATGVTAENITDGQILSYMVQLELQKEASQKAKLENISPYEDEYRKKVNAVKQRKANPTAVKEKPAVKPSKK